MTKGKGFSFAGLVNPETVPDAPEGVEQRGAEKRPVGRPKIAERVDSKRIAVTVDGETYRRVAHACIDMGIDRQTFLERAIARMLKDTE